MSYGWLLDGFNSNSAGFSVLDSFTLTSGAGLNKTYTSGVLRHANSIKLLTVLAAGAQDYTLYTYPTLSAVLNKTDGTATVSGTGGSYAFFIVVFIQ